MIDRVDQHRDAERVGQEDELLTLVGAHLTRAGQERDRLLPLGAGRLELAHYRVQVGGDHVEYPARARILTRHCVAARPALNCLR